MLKCICGISNEWKCIYGISYELKCICGTNELVSHSLGAQSNHTKPLNI